MHIYWLEGCGHHDINVACIQNFLYQRKILFDLIRTDKKYDLNEIFFIYSINMIQVKVISKFTLYDQKNRW